MRVNDIPQFEKQNSEFFFVTEFMFSLKYMGRSRSSRFSSRVRSVKINIKMKIKIVDRELHARHTVHSDCYAHTKV